MKKLLLTIFVLFLGLGVYAQHFSNLPEKERNEKLIKEAKKGKAPIEFERFDNPHDIKNGKEHDAIHGLDLLDYGARMYDNKTGRWIAVDRLAEDYYQISPYAYCLNNPMKYVDPDGAVVRPYGVLALTTILNTLSILDRYYVVLDKDGNIDSDILNQHNSKSDNFTKLKNLVNSKLVFNIYIQSTYSYKDNERQIKDSYLTYIEPDEEFFDRDFKSPSGLTTGETGKYGITLLPGKGSSTVNSIDNATHIPLNNPY